MKLTPSKKKADRFSLQGKPADCKQQVSVKTLATSKLNTLFFFLSLIVILGLNDGALN